MRTSKLKYGKSLAAMAACLALILAGVPAFADATAPLDETLYFQLDLEGAIKDAIAVMTVYPEGTSETVYGAYEKLENLTNTELPKLQDQSVTFDGLEKGEPFYFRGNVKHPVNPWDVKIAYALDGNPVAPETLSDANGHLEMAIEITGNPEAKVRFSEQYALQMTVTLADDVARHISALGGTVVKVGSEHRVVVNVLPGFSQKAHIEADISNFEMKAITFGATKADFDVDVDPDSAQSGFKKMLDGGEDLVSGMEAYQKGLNTAVSGVKRVSGGAADLANRGGQLAAGNAAVEDALGQIAAKGGQLRQGLLELQKQYRTTAQSMQGVDVLATQLSQSPDPAVKQLAQAMLGQLQFNQGVETGLMNLSAGLAQYTQGLQGLYAQYGALSQGWDQYIQGVRQLQAGLSQTAGGFSALPKGLAELLKGQKELVSGIRDADAELSKMLGQLPSGVDTQAPLKSYLDDRNTVKSVQFVMQTPAIEIPKPEDPAIPVPPEQSLWDRIKALFQ